MPTQKDVDLRALYPKEPWRWRAEWRDGQVPADAMAQTMGLLVLAALFIFPSLVLLAIMPGELKQGKVEAWLYPLAILPGLFFLYVARARKAQHRRIGPLVFKMDPMPGSWGGFLSGTITIPRGVTVKGDIKLILTNTHRRTKMVNGKPSMADVPLWRFEEVVPDPSHGSRGGLESLPVRIPIPRGPGQPDHPGGGSEGLMWRLILNVPVQELPLALESVFRVPVFDLGETVIPKQS